jgi:hypothetical protein
MHHVEEAVDVHVQDLAPVFVRSRAVDGVPDDDPGVVHDDPHRAYVAPHAFGESGARRRIRHIKLIGARLAAG